MVVEYIALRPTHEVKSSSDNLRWLSGTPPLFLASMIESASLIPAPYTSELGVRRKFLVWLIKSSDFKVDKGIFGLGFIISGAG